MAKTLTPKELAQSFNSDGRTVRKFLRSITPKADQPGKGSRWAIEARKVNSLRKQFTAWDEARRAAAEDADAEDEVEEVSPEEATDAPEDAVEELDEELEVEELTD
jgi:hypothetical protein